MKHNQSDKTASAPETRKAAKFDKSWIGCVIDNSSFSANDCNSESGNYHPTERCAELICPRQNGNHPSGSLFPAKGAQWQKL